VVRNDSFFLKYSYDVTVSNVFKEISKNLKTNTLLFFIFLSFFLKYFRWLDNDKCVENCVLNSDGSYNQRDSNGRCKCGEADGSNINCITSQRCLNNKCEEVMFSESKFGSSTEACTDDCPIGNYCTGPWDATGTKNNGGGGMFKCDNEWTLAISSQAITEKVGATVTQGASTGTLKTSLNGATTSVVIQATAGVTFIATGNIVIGSTTVVLANIDTVTSTTLCDTVGSVTTNGMKICSFSQASGGDFTVDKLGCRLANTITLNADKSMSVSGVPGTNPSDEPISELQAPGFVSDTLTSTRHFTLGNLYSDTGISLTLSWLKLTGGTLVNQKQM